MKSSATYPQNSSFIAEYLADREGLGGTPRQIFLQLLGSMMQPDATSRRSWSRLVEGGVLVVAAVGIGLEFLIHEGMGVVSMVMWLLFVLGGWAMGMAMARAESEEEEPSPETEWKIYCMLLRPHILSAQPGLLDRNRVEARLSEERLELPTGRALTSILEERPSSLWGPGAVGWCVGMIGFVVWRMTAGPVVMAGVLPVAGFLLAPVVWALLRLAIYRRMERVAHELS